MVHKTKMVDVISFCHSERTLGRATNVHFQNAPSIVEKDLERCSNGVKEWAKRWCSDFYWFIFWSSCRLLIISRRYRMLILVSGFLLAYHSFCAVCHSGACDFHKVSFLFPYIWELWSLYPKVSLSFISKNWEGAMTNLFMAVLFFCFFFCVPEVALFS